MAIQSPNPGLGDGQTGDNEFVMWTKVRDNFNNNTHAANRLVGTAAGNVMEVGAFGLGVPIAFTSTDAKDKMALAVGNFALTQGAPADAEGGVLSAGFLTSLPWSTGGASVVAKQLYFGAYNSDFKIRERPSASAAYAPWRTVYHTANTTKDANGFLKAASPIVNLFADKIELNDEAGLQPITFEKLGVGDYLVKGSTGFAQEGWYIEMPKDANGNVLVAVVYEQLENNDISVKTYAKKFDEETGDIVANTAKPRDIPSTRWIDLRLQSLPQEDIQSLDTDETVNTNAE